MHILAEKKPAVNKKILKKVLTKQDILCIIKSEIEVDNMKGENNVYELLQI